MVLKAFGHCYSAALQVVRTQLDCPLQDCVQLDRFALRRHLAGEAQQILHNLLGPLRLLQNYTQIFACALRDLGIFQQQVCKS